MSNAPMPRVLNFGSLNIDHVYGVDHFVRPGETLASASYRRFAGGKGANQSLALARAGSRVFHAGKIGADGRWLKELLGTNGVDVTYVEEIDGPSGHALIQVNPAGENAIVIHGGANHQVTPADAARVVAAFGAGDFLLIQNEISALPDIISAAAGRGLIVVFNPAPMTQAVLGYPLALVSWFIVNEVEAEQLTGEGEPERALAALARNFPSASTVLTLGSKGAYCHARGQRLRAPAVPVTPVDTTAAGDTFIGYFLAELGAGQDLAAALRVANQAAALCVTRPGAADSIPRREELPQ